MPRPRKPAHLKAIQGTDRINKQRLNINEPREIGEIGEAPSYFNQAERDTWEEIKSIMYEGVAGTADRVALELLTRLMVEYRSAPENFQAAKLTIIGKLLSSFCMNPSDRTRVSIIPKRKENPFSAL